MLKQFSDKKVIAFKQNNSFYFIAQDNSILTNSTMWNQPRIEHKSIDNS